jgi:hypothetical protein
MPDCYIVTNHISICYNINHHKNTSLRVQNEETRNINQISKVTVRDPQKNVCQQSEHTHFKTNT